ncbi:MAG: thiamine-phosphate kinase, partial [Proteobacteria bacterium]
TAVLSSSKSKLLFCSDMMIESVHFNLEFITPRELGHKALAVCFSDLVAMNGRGLAATVSLALPIREDFSKESFVEEFYEGLGALAKQLEIDCVGGDLSFSPNSIFIDVACVGESSNPKLRSGASPGDWVAVSGTPGASAAGLYDLQRSQQTTLSLRQQHLTPLPRIDLLPVLTHATALIDISDGLASELHHIAKASKVGFEIDAARIPLHPDAVKLAPERALDWALHGGEDYELLMTGAPETPCPLRFTVIGRVTEGPEVVITDLNGAKRLLEPRGYDHFGR